VILRRLHLRRVPGIDPPFELDGLAPGLNLIVGPNGSGKSSVRRALHMLLWPDPARDADADVEAVLERDDRPLHAHLARGATTFEGGAPRLPDPHLAGCHAIGMTDLLETAHGRDRELATEFRRELEGGYDLAAVRDGFARGARYGQRERDALTRAEAGLATVLQQQSGLAAEEDRLAELNEQLAAAKDGARRVGLLEAAKKHARAERQAAVYRGRLAELPDALADMTGREGADADRLSQDVAAERAKLDELDRKLASLAGKVGKGELPEPAELEAAELRVLELRDEERKLAEAEAEFERRRAMAKANVRSSSEVRWRRWFVGFVAITIAGAVAGGLGFVAGWLVALFALGLSISAGVNVLRRTKSSPVDVAAAEADVRTAAGRRDALLSALGELLGDVRDEKDARARLARLRQDSVEQREARARHDELAHERPRVAEQLSDLETRCADVYRRCGLEPGDFVALEDRLALRDDHRTLTSKLAEVTRDLEIHGADLDGVDELKQLAAEDAEEQRAEAEALAESAEELHAEIVAIRTRIEAAIAGDAAEVARAAVTDAERALDDRRADALEAAAGRFLLDDVQGEYDVEAQPEVQKRAAAYLQAFTRGRLELVVDRDAGFRARDTRSGQRRELGEVSDGERAQLLLAARLAYVTYADADDPLPLFLDDSLVTADPQRFRAVAEAVLELARQGRQVFYTTARSGDVEFWRTIASELGGAEPLVIDLAALRGMQAAPDDPGWLETAYARAPDLDGLDAAQIAEQLQPPPPDPFRPGALHLWHALAEELPALRRLVETGIDAVGPWHACERGPVAELALPLAGERRRVEARVALAEATLEAWRVGRGRRLTPADLQRSGAISPTWFDRVEGLLDDADGDAKALVAALTDKTDARAKGFRDKKTEELVEFLVEEELLDDRAPLARDAAAIRALATASAPLQRSGIDAADARSDFDRLWSSLEGA
jgi:energy-coupling factor transporter ATP-binding protein EcfA2/uncharacterized protein YjbJ (UPF0337 family)